LNIDSLNAVEMQPKSKTQSAFLMSTLSSCSHSLPITVNANVPPVNAEMLNKTNTTPFKILKRNSLYMLRNLLQRRGEGTGIVSIYEAMVLMKGKAYLDQNYLIAAFHGMIVPWGWPAAWALFEGMTSSLIYPSDDS
jgi:hypothetical protein